MAVEQACWPKSGCARNCRRVEAAKPRTWVIHNASAATTGASAVFIVLVLVIVPRSLQIERTIKRTRNENDRTPELSQPATTWTDGRTLPWAKPTSPPFLLHQGYGGHVGHLFSVRRA